MIVERKQLNDELKTQLKKFYDTNEIRLIAENVNATHNIPEEIVYDLINGNIEPKQLSDFEIFCIYETILPKLITEYYTSTEIEKYSKFQYKVNEIQLPIKISAMKVNDEQWITASDSNFLMLLKEKGLLIYNTNTQRTMTRYTNSSTETYVITLNKQAVKQIKNLIQGGSYIPNVITLNIPEDSDFEYKDGQLVINDISGFDIIDGYHRFVAMSQVHDVDPDFNYPIELRLVSFSESKARQFIYQEDQKTQMSKIDSESFNQNNNANIIVKKLNDDIDFNLYKKVDKSQIIDEAFLSDSINKIYNVKNLTRPELLKIKNEIKNGINTITESNLSLLNKKWNYEYTFIIIALIKLNKIDKLDKVLIGIKDYVFNRNSIRKNIKTIDALAR